MNDNENKKSNEELTDEELDKVAGGDGWIDIDEYDKMCTYAKAFMDRNCKRCSIMNSDICLLWLDDKVFYDMFGGDPNAKCPNLKSI